MVNPRLAESYLRRAQVRLQVLTSFLAQKDYPDVIREAQEVVELSQKAILIHMGVDPPKWHEVGDLLLDRLSQFPPRWQQELPALVQEGRWLRSQREVAFYGEMDLIPETLYGAEEAQRAIRVATAFTELARHVMGEPSA